MVRRRQRAIDREKYSYRCELIAEKPDRQREGIGPIGKSRIGI